MKRLRAAVIAILAVAVVGVVAWVVPDGGFNYIERASGVMLPPGSRGAQTYLPTDWAIVGCARLDTAEIDKFVRVHGFSPEQDRRQELDDIFFDQMPVEFQSIPSSGDLVHLYGFSESNIWSFTLDRATGRLWCLVHFPDPAGDLFIPEDLPQRPTPFEPLPDP